MKREIPLVIVFIAGMIMVVQYFVPHAYSDFLFTYANDWVIVIGILSLPIGIYSLISTTVRKASSGLRASRSAALSGADAGGTGGAAAAAPPEGVSGRGEVFYAFVMLGGFLIMVLTGLTKDQVNDPEGLHRQLFNNVLTPAQTSLFAMLAFYIASAAYRAFRVRTVLAAVLLITAFVVMLRIVPLPDPIGEWNRALVRWILAVPNLASKRAIIIGVALGAVAYSIKILLGIERSYMGRE
jgi:hypothetical protein